MIVGGAEWYFGHKREVAPEKLSGSTQVEKQIPIVNPTEDVARAQQPQQEVGAKEGFPESNSPTIAQPSIAPGRGPWLFPDSSSRYLSATDLSSLSSADLWRARNEIFARKGYKFSTPRGIAFAQTLGNYYRGVDDDQGRVLNNMNQYERANVTLIRAIEKGR
jgi:YARHG domain-containing protein